MDNDEFRNFFNYYINMLLISSFIILVESWEVIGMYNVGCDNVLLVLIFFCRVVECFVELISGFVVSFGLGRKFF